MCKKPRILTLAVLVLSATKIICFFFVISSPDVCANIQVIYPVQHLTSRPVSIGFIWNYVPQIGLFERKKSICLYLLNIKVTGIAHLLLP